MSSPSATMWRRVIVVIVGTPLAFAAIQLFPDDRTQAKLFFAGVVVVVGIVGAVSERVWKSRSGGREPE